MLAPSARIASVNPGKQRLNRLFQDQGVLRHVFSFSGAVQSRAFSVTAFTASFNWSESHESGVLERGGLGRKEGSPHENGSWSKRELEYEEGSYKLWKRK